MLEARALPSLIPFGAKLFENRNCPVKGAADSRTRAAARPRYGLFFVNALTQR
jgi:hypothetical protein